MNEDLIKLAFSKFEGQADYDTFKKDFLNDRKLRELAYSKFKVSGGTFEDFEKDLGLSIAAEKTPPQKSSVSNKENNINSNPPSIEQPIMPNWHKGLFPVKEAEGVIITPEQQRQVDKENLAKGSRITKEKLIRVSESAPISSEEGVIQTMLEKGKGNLSYDRHDTRTWTNNNNPTVGVNITPSELEKGFYQKTKGDIQTIKKEAANNPFFKVDLKGRGTDIKTNICIEDAEGNCVETLTTPSIKRTSFEEKTLGLDRVNFQDALKLNNDLISGLTTKITLDRGEDFIKGYPNTISILNNLAKKLESLSRDIEKKDNSDAGVQFFQNMKSRDNAINAISSEIGGVNKTLSGYNKEFEALEKEQLNLGVQYKTGALPYTDYLRLFNEAAAKKDNKISEFNEVAARGKELETQYLSSIDLYNKEKAKAPSNPLITEYNKTRERLTEVMRAYRVYEDDEDFQELLKAYGKSEDFKDVFKVFAPEEHRQKILLEAQEAYANAVTLERKSKTRGGKAWMDFKNTLKILGGATGFTNPNPYIKQESLRLASTPTGNGMLPNVAGMVAGWLLNTANDFFSLAELGLNTVGVDEKTLKKVENLRRDELSFPQSMVNAAMGGAKRHFYEEQLELKSSNIGDESLYEVFKPRDKLVIDNGEVVGIRSKDSDILEGFLSEDTKNAAQNIYNANKDKTTSSFSLVGGIEDAVPSILDLVAMMYGGGAISKMAKGFRLPVVPVLEKYGIKTGTVLGDGVITPTTSVGFSFLQQYGDIYDSHIQRGVGVSDALNYAFKETAVSSFMEIMFSPFEMKLQKSVNGRMFGQLIDAKNATIRDVISGRTPLIGWGDTFLKYTKQKGGALLENYVKDAMPEVATEILQNYNSAYWEAESKDEMTKLPSFSENVNAAFGAAFITAAVGLPSANSKYNIDLRATAAYNAVNNPSGVIDDTDFKTVQEAKEWLNKYGLVTTDEKLKKKAQQIVLAYDEILPQVKKELEAFEGENLTEEQKVAIAGAALDKAIAKAKLLKETDKSSRLSNKLGSTIAMADAQIDYIVKNPDALTADPILKSRNWSLVHEDRDKHKGVIIWDKGVSPDREYKVGDKVDFGSLGSITITEIGKDASGNPMFRYETNDKKKAKRQETQNQDNTEEEEVTTESTTSAQREGATTTDGEQVTEEVVPQGGEVKETVEGVDFSVGNYDIKGDKVAKRQVSADGATTTTVDVEVKDGQTVQEAIEEHIDANRRQELDSVSNIINQEDKAYLEERINQRADKDLQDVKDAFKDRGTASQANEVVEPKQEVDKPSESQQVVDDFMQEFDNHIAELGITAEINLALDDIGTRMNNAEYITEAELEGHSTKLYEIWDKVDNDNRLTSEQKESIKSKLENEIEKLESYELATENKVGVTTERTAVKSTRIVGRTKSETPTRFAVTPERFEGLDVTVTAPNGESKVGSFVVFSGGTIGVEDGDGNILPVTDGYTYTETLKDKEGNVTGGVLTDNGSGFTYTINDSDLALDIAIKAKEEALGGIYEPLFEEAVVTVTKEVKVEPKLTREDRVSVKPNKNENVTPLNTDSSKGEINTSSNTELSSKETETPKKTAPKAETNKITFKLTNTGEKEFTKVGDLWQYEVGGKTKTVRSESNIAALDKELARVNSLEANMPTTPQQGEVVNEGSETKNTTKAPLSVEDVISKLNKLLVDPKKKNNRANVSLFGLDIVFNGIKDNIGIPLWNRAIKILSNEVEKGTNSGKAIIKAANYIENNIKGKDWGRGKFIKGFKGFFNGLNKRGNNKGVTVSITPYAGARIQKYKNLQDSLNAFITAGNFKAAQEVAKEMQDDLIFRLNQLLPDVKIKGKSVDGLWQGSAEQSFSLHIDKVSDDVFAAIVKIAQDFDQDAVHILYLSDKINNDEIVGVEDANGRAIIPVVNFEFKHPITAAEFGKIVKDNGIDGASLDSDGYGAVIYDSTMYATKEEAEKGHKIFYNKINNIKNDSKRITGAVRANMSEQRFAAFKRSGQEKGGRTYAWGHGNIQKSDEYRARENDERTAAGWAVRHLPKKVRDAVQKVASLTPKIGTYLTLNKSSDDYKRLQSIGRMFDRMPIVDLSPKVKSAYNTLNEIIKAQYDRLPIKVYPNNRPIISHENIEQIQGIVNELNTAIEAKDIKKITELQKQLDNVVGWSENRYDDAYSNSKQMMADVNRNNQMEFFTTGSGFGDGSVDYTGHPLLEPTHYYTTPVPAQDKNGKIIYDKDGNEVLIPKQLLNNDVLRVVHDYVAHAASGASFGAKGEERAWAAHVASIINEQGFSDRQKLIAIQALTSETRGQNTWVNFVNEFNRDIRNPLLEIKRNAEKNNDLDTAAKADDMLSELPYTEFADQKVGLLPTETMIGGYESTADSDKWIKDKLEKEKLYESEQSEGNMKEQSLPEDISDVGEFIEDAREKDNENNTENENNVSEEVKDDFNSVLGISQQATSETDFTGDEGEANFNRWKGDNKLVSGSEVQDVKTGQPVVIKGFHGFYEFDSSVHGNIEGYLGKVNYFTTSESDADQNYQTGGADLTNRIESRVDEIESTLENEIGEGLEGEALDEAIQDVITENYPNFDSSSLDFNMTLREVAERIANNELHGGEDTTLEVYVKLNNPVVLGNGATWFDVYDISESSLEEAATEFAEENDITVEEAKEDYAGEIRERAAEIDGVENEVLDALSQALFRNGYDSSEAHRIMEDMVYEESVDLNKLEQSIRKGELYENDEGEMASAQVISDMFQILGFDGIILTDVSERFRGMGLDSSTSHVHVFDAYNNQIKLSDGTNTTFGETSDIRFQADGQEVTEEKQNVANKILDYIKDKIKYFKDGNNIVVDAKEFANKLRELGFGDLRAMAWSKNFPIVIPQTNLRSLRNHPDYDAAKNKGDYKAAERVVKDIIKKDKINTILSGNKNVTIVPVLAEEGKGLNKLPLAYARELAKESNGEVAGISQTNVTSHTDSGAIERMFRTPNFNGEVIKGKKYLIVDDVVTSGSTVRALKEYIENNGGKVIGVSSLSNISSIHGGYSGNLAIKQDTIKKLREKFIIRQLNSLLLQYGIAEKYQDLTNAQAIYLLQFKDIDRLRDKFNDAGILSRLKRSGEEGRSEGETDRVREVSQENLRLLSTPQGDVYGFVHGGKMYLDPNKLTPDLVGEEFIHLQQQGLRLAAESGNKEAKRIVDAWDALTNDAAEAFMTDAQEGGISEEARDLLNLLGIPYKEMSADAYKRQDGESDADYKLRLQDELWAKAQKKDFAERAEKLSEEGKLSEIGRKVYEAVKDFFRFINESLGLYIPKQWKNLSLSEIIDRTNEVITSDKFLQDLKRAEEAIGVKDDKSVVKKMMIGGQEVNVKTLPQVTNGFYSPIEKKLLDEKATNLSATKWLERLGKGDEMTFTGLKDFLESKKPNEQVKKSELQDFLRDNRIEVVEVVKGGDASEAEIDAFLEDEVGEGYTREEAREYLSNDETNEQTKYGQYQLNGEKENYKEVLVTMPSFKWAKNKSGLWAYFNNEGVQISDGMPEDTETYKELAKNTLKKSQAKPDFKSSHFPEPNILVHLRMNTRTDSEGNKVLFIEEIQSDWGQEGKKEGFDLSKEEKRKLIEEHKRVLSDLQEIDEKIISNVESGNKDKSAYDLAQQKIKLQEKSESLKDKIFKAKAPQAPFVTDTNAWTKLGLKVALKEAVKQGVDKIAWTTGEQQNDRYDLSNSVDGLEYQPQRDGKYDVFAHKGDNNIFYEKGIDLKRIEDVFGKDIADKISKNEGTKATYDPNKFYKRLEGDGLKVGGKGMKGFYGSPTDGSLGIVGNVAKKLFGQEPTTITLQDGTTQHAITITPEMRQQAQEGQPLFMAGYNQYLSKSDFDNNGNVKPEVLEEIRKEREKIVREAKANGTYMKAPNGKATNLNEQQWVDVRTKRFKDWFGDWEGSPENASKVVDENGEPLVVYHTSDVEFYKFDENKIGKNYTLRHGNGFYFSSGILGHRQWGSINKMLFLNIRNIRKSSLSFREEAKENGFLNTYDNSVDIASYAKKVGVDGLFAGDSFNKEFIVFFPNQIKSASSNVGTFSNESNDIRFSISNSNTNFNDNETEGGVKPTVNEGGSSTIDEVNNIDSATRPPSLKEAAKNLKDAVLDLFIGGNNNLGIYYDPKMEALNFYNKGGKVFKTFVDLMKSVATQAGVATMDSKGKLVWKEWANVTQQEKDGLFTEFRNSLTGLNTNINIDEDGLEYLALWASDSELMKAKVKAISALQDEIDSLYESFARGETNRQDFAIKVQEVLKDFNRDQKNTSYFSASDIAKLLKAAKDVKDTASLNNFENKFYDIVSGKDFNKLKAATVKLKKAAIRAIQTIKNPNTTSNNPNGVTQGKERLALSYNPLDKRAYNKLPQVLNLQRLPNESNTAYKRAQRLEAERLYREDIRRFNDMLTVMANKEIGKDSAKYKNDINYFADMAAHQFNIKEQEKALRESTYDTDGNLLDIYGNIETLYQDLPAEYQEVADVRKLQFDNNGNIIDTDGNIIKDFNSLDEKELRELERRKKLEDKELNKIQTAAEKEQARLDNKDKIRSLINIGRQVLPFKEFQAILDDFLSITDEQLDKLSNQELEELIKGYDNLINLNRVNTGFEYLIKKALDGSVATEVINTLDSRGNSFRSLLRDRITNIFKGKNIVDGIERFMRNTPLRRIDAIFSGKEGTEMYDTFIYKIAQGMGVFTAFSNKLKDEYRGLTKSIKQDDEFLLRLYTMDRQYRNNPDSDEIMSVAEEVELIREAISLDKNLKESLYADFVELYDKLQIEHGGEFDYTKIQLDKRQQALLDFVDTHLDNTVGKVVVTAARTGEATKIYNNYTPLGRVSSKSITDEMKDFADGIMDFDGGVANREYFSPITPGFIKARQSGKISPIRDVLFSRVTYEAIRGIHLDYNMRDAFKTFENRIKDTERELDNKIKDIRKDAKDKVEKLTEQLENQKQVLTFQLQGADARTARVLNGQIADIDKQIKALDESDIIKASEEKIDAYKNDKMFIQVMGKVVKDVAKDTLHNQYTPLSGIDVYTELVASVGYASVLTSIPRGMAEFASNIFYASLYPVEMMLGVKQLAKMLKDDKSVNRLKELLTQIPSTQPNRLIVHSGSLRRDTAETKKFGIAATVGRGKRIVENLTSVIDSVNDAILGTSDRVISMPMWLGAFEKEFNNQKRIEIKNRLGRSNYNSEYEFNAAVNREFKKERLNLEEFVNNSDYRFKNKVISDKAVKFADRVLTEGFASFNAFEGIPNLKMTKGDGFLKVYDKFLQRFNKFEYQSFEDSISSLLGRGYLSKNEAARVLTATLSRLAIYNYLTGKLRDWWNDEAFAPAVNAVSNTIGEALGVEGDKDLVAIPDRVDNTEEEDLYKKKRAFIGGLISVSLQRRLGGLGRLPINFAVEMANGLYGEDLGLRKGAEYNAYENSLLFSSVKIPNFTSLQREDGELSDDGLNIPFTDKAMGLKAISPDKYLIDLFAGITGPYSVFSKNMADLSRLAFRNLGMNKDLAFLKTINPYKEQAVIDYANNIIGYKFLASQIPIPMAKDVHVVMNNSLSAINFGVAIKDNDYKNATKSNATQMDIELGVKAVERLIKEETSLMKERLIDIIESEEIFNKIEDAYINGIGAKTPESFTVALKNEKGKYNKKNTYSTFTLSDDSVIWGTTTEIDKSDFEDLSEKGRLVYDVYNGEDNTTKYFEVKPVRNKYQLAQLNKLYTYSKYQKVWEDIMVKLHSESLFKHVEPYEREFGVIGWKAKSTKLTEIGEEDPDTEIDITKYFRN